MKPVTVKTFKAFALTIRPLDGATAKHDNILVDWLRKKCDYYYVVSEKLDTERHLHCGLFLKRPMTRSNMTVNLKRLFSDLSEEEKRVLNQGVKIMYNIDFMEEYMQKGDDTEEIIKNLPEAGTLDSYWPPSEEQAKARASAAKDRFYANLENLWNTHRGPAIEINYQIVAAFLSDMMFSTRAIRVLKDDKTHGQTAKNLVRYLLKDTTHVPELAPWETMN